MVNKLTFQSAVKYASFLFATGEFHNSCSQSVSDNPSIHLPLFSQYHSPIIYSIPAQSYHVKCCDLSQLLLFPSETKILQLFYSCLPTPRPVVLVLARSKEYNRRQLYVTIWIHSALMDWIVDVILVTLTHKYYSRTRKRTEEGRKDDQNNERFGSDKD